METLKFSDLKKGQLYTDTTDPRFPLEYTGEFEERNQFNSYSKIAKFRMLVPNQYKNSPSEDLIVSKAFNEKPDTNEWIADYLELRATYTHCHIANLTCVILDTTSKGFKVKETQAFPGSRKADRTSIKYYESVYFDKGKDPCWLQNEIQPLRAQRLIEEFNPEDSEEDQDDDEIKPDGYECICCGHIQDKSTGFGCDKCAGPLNDWFS